MAIPRKGSRRIVVDNIEYLWYIRRKPTYDQSLDGGLTFAVEMISEEKTATLVVNSPTHRPDSYLGDSPVFISPKDVEKAIQTALSVGWQPIDGKTFQIHLALGQPIIRHHNAPNEVL